MTSRPSFLSPNSRNRLIAAAVLGAAGGAAWIVRSKRPLPPEPAPEPPRIGHTRDIAAVNGSASAQRTGADEH